MDTDYYVLHKILIGDDGDDVPSTWKMQTTTAKGEVKFVRVTDKKAERIIEIVTTPVSDHSLSVSEWLDVLQRKANPKALSRYNFGDVDLDKRLDEISGVLLRVMGDVDDTELRKKVGDNIVRNTRLVWLIDDMLPFNVSQMINESIVSSFKRVPSADRQKWNKNSLLGGTRFGKMKVAPRGFDPFEMGPLPDEI